MVYRPDQPRDENGQWSSGLQVSLIHQLRMKGNSPEEAEKLSREIMINQGTMDWRTGNLTAKGREREAMGRNARRIDRAARQLGREPEEIGLKSGKPFVK